MVAAGPRGYAADMKTFPFVAAAALLLGAVSSRAQYGPQEVPQPDAAGAEQGVRAGAADMPEMSGTVERVDRAAGEVVVRTARDTVRLPFPAATLAELAPGDRVVVRVGIARVRATDSTSSEGSGSHAIDPETGSPGARPPAAGAPR
jgi:hypothetical protein